MLPKKILIIDDERMIRVTTAILLKQQNVAVMEAASGEEGIAMAKEHNPDLILLDIMMPEMDGWEVYEKLQEDEKMKQIPVVIFTAGDYLEAENRARKEEVFGVLRKPFRLPELLSMLELD
jgi:two-component system alkaline phosphatase synthesis response regulator PhoP